MSHAVTRVLMRVSGIGDQIARACIRTSSQWIYDAASTAGESSLGCGRKTGLAKFRGRAGGPMRRDHERATMSRDCQGEGHDRLLREISLALAGRRGATVLVAEDDDDLRGVLTASLTRNGHRVIQARDGAEALASLERDQVDLLVLDLVMPNIDGFEVLARLKGSARPHAAGCRLSPAPIRSTTELQALRSGPTSI